MQFGTRGFVIAGGLVLGCLCVPASAQLPPPTPPPPTTLWSFLGIPQGYRYLRDNGLNRSGNRPGLERKPPLKAIADPKNLKSDNPAIKKAAEVKQAEDEKKQKIKAIKYLAQIGCGCYNRDGSITDALLKSMDDCTEEVRLATVQAISEAANGEYCANCKQRSCCSEEISNKLYEIAYERDDTGCYLEPSERVRNAAAEALRVCCPGRGEDLIFESAPPPAASGAEQPSVLPESGGERPAIPGPPVPTPATPLQDLRPAPAPRAVAPPLPPAAGPAATPRSSRRTALLERTTEASAERAPETPRAAVAISPPESPHWPLSGMHRAVQSPVRRSSPSAGHEFASATNQEAPAAEPRDAGQRVTVKVSSASLTRLPPVDAQLANEQSSNESVAAPPLPPITTPATMISTRRSAATMPAQPTTKGASAPKVNRAPHPVAPRALPGQEFGVGTVTSVRFKDGQAFLEFENAAPLPPGSVLRAYHEFALTGKSPVCDLEVVDGGEGRTVAVARQGSEITALAVGDRAIVLR